MRRIVSCPARNVNGDGRHSVPHIYRCAECEGWITSCDTTIEWAAQGECGGELISALDCTHFGEKPSAHTVCYGRLEAGETPLRYHNTHVVDNEYVQEGALRTEEDRRRMLLPHSP